MPIQKELEASHTGWLDSTNSLRSKIAPHQVIEQPKLDVERSQVLSKEINKLCQKRVIVLTTNDGTGFVSPVFVIPKAGEKW